MNVYEIKTMEASVKGNSYVGRGIVLGKSRDGKKAVSAYFIMGRSENSRNRIFLEEDENVMIKPFDESKVEVYFWQRLNVQDEHFKERRSGRYGLQQILL